MRLDDLIIVLINHVSVFKFLVRLDLDLKLLDIFAEIIGEHDCVR